MFTSVKLGADFSRGCAGKRSGYLLFATRPRYPGIRRIDSGRHTLVANRTGFIRVCGYELSRMYLPRRLVIKPWSMHRTPTGGIMLMGSTR
jgi:hypothetical protein